VFPVVDAYPDPFEPDDYPTRNIYIAAADHPRIEPEHTGEPRQAPSLDEAIARMQPFPVASGVILSDDAAPLEPLVWRTTEYLRYQTGDYLPVNVLYH